MFSIENSLFSQRKYQFKNFPCLKSHALDTGNIQGVEGKRCGAGKGCKLLTIFVNKLGNVERSIHSRFLRSIYTKSSYTQRTYLFYTRTSEYLVQRPFWIAAQAFPPQHPSESAETSTQNLLRFIIGKHIVHNSSNAVIICSKTF